MRADLMKVSSTGEKHGLINEVANSNHGDGFAHMSPEIKAKAEKKKKHDSEIIEAKYLNSRGSTERLTRPYCLGSGEPIQTWHFIPNETYKVPRGLVTDVNDPNKRMPKRSQILDSKGMPTVKDEFHDPVHQFIPTSF